MKSLVFLLWINSSSLSLASHTTKTTTTCVCRHQGAQLMAPLKPLENHGTKLLRGLRGPLIGALWGTLSVRVLGNRCDACQPSTFVCKERSCYIKLADENLRRTPTRRYLFEILFNQTEIRLYLPSYD